MVAENEPHGGGSRHGAEKGKPKKRARVGKEEAQPETSAPPPKPGEILFVNLFLAKAQQFRNMDKVPKAVPFERGEIEDDCENITIKKVTDWIMDSVPKQTDSVFESKTGWKLAEDKQLCQSSSSDARVQCLPGDLQLKVGGGPNSALIDPDKDQPLWSMAVQFSEEEHKVVGANEYPCDGLPLPDKGGYLLCDNCETWITLTPEEYKAWQKKGKFYCNCVGRECLRKAKIVSLVLSITAAKPDKTVHELIVRIEAPSIRHKVGSDAVFTPLNKIFVVKTLELIDSDAREDGSHVDDDSPCLYERLLKLAHAATRSQAASLRGEDRDAFQRCHSKRKGAVILLAANSHSNQQGLKPLRGLADILDLDAVNKSLEHMRSGSNPSKGKIRLSLLATSPDSMQKGKELDDAVLSTREWCAEDFDELVDETLSTRAVDPPCSQNELKRQAVKAQSERETVMENVYVLFKTLGYSKAFPWMTASALECLRRRWRMQAKTDAAGENVGTWAEVVTAGQNMEANSDEAIEFLTKSFPHADADCVQGEGTACWRVRLVTGMDSDVHVHSCRLRPYDAAEAFTHPYDGWISGCVWSFRWRRALPPVPEKQWRHGCRRGRDSRGGEGRQV